MTLPKGGGAVRGIGEKFSTNPLTGTATISVPIFTTPSRWDFYPKLSVTYDSGNGNGIFGLGWDISIHLFQERQKKDYQDTGTKRILIPKSKSDDNKDQSTDKSTKTKSCIEGYHLNQKAFLVLFVGQVSVFGQTAGQGVVGQIIGDDKVQFYGHDVKVYQASGDKIVYVSLIFKNIKSNHQFFSPYQVSRFRISRI